MLHAVFSASDLERVSEISESEEAACVERIANEVVGVRHENAKLLRERVDSGKLIAILGKEVESLKKETTRLRKENEESKRDVEEVILWRLKAHSFLNGLLMFVKVWKAAAR